MPELELRLFGPPRVRRNGVDMRFDTRKAVALLSLLAATEREHPRDALAALLWPELERSRARATLRRTLSVASAVGPALEVTAAGARLDFARVSCDVRDFRLLVAANDPSSWVRAVALAADRFLDGFSLRDSPAFEDWQIATGDSLRDQLSQTLARLVAHAVRHGKLQNALNFARRRTQVDPLSEPAHVDLIHVTAWTGDRPSALQAYRALVRLLDRELGVPPLPSTVALHDAIRTDRLPPPRVAARTRDEPSAERPSEPTLVSRERELGLLGGVWRDTAQNGRSIGLVGEPGVGKTALARALASRISSPVLWIGGHAAEQPLAFAAANDLVRAMLVLRPALVTELGPLGRPLGVLATEVDVEESREIHTPGELQRVHEAVRAALGTLAGDTRLLLVIDDAHLLDRPSSALFAYLLRRLPARLLVLAMWPTGAGAATLPVAAVESGDTLMIAPLDPAGVAQLVAGSGLDAEEVHRRTRGIPLLVREYTAIAAQGDAEFADARGIVFSRLEAASDIARQLVGAAAVIGTITDPELLRVVSGRDEVETVDAIEEAIARGLLVERADRGGYDVPHDLVRDAALARLSLARTRLLHGRVAEVLARRNSIDPLATPAGLVARHLAEAGRSEDAGDWFLAAAAESTRLFAHEQALDQLRQAQALGHHPLDVHQAIGGVLVRLGRYDEALVSFDQAAALAEEDPLRAAAIEHAAAGVHDRLGDWALAEAHLATARDLIGSGPKRARILADLALVQHRQKRAAEAGANASDAAREAAGDGAALAQAANVLGVLAVADGNYPGALEHLAEAMRLARDLGDPELLIAALNNLSRTQHTVGDEAAALLAGHEALELAERQGDRHRVAALHSHLADLLHAGGREEEALAQLKSSAAAFSQVQGAGMRPEIWTVTEW